ncbi:zinc transporter ZIP3 [Nephila pilipes]|uniref:Zinc transporter ZIP3 n=1 Tax=Nephila pilipes TaxID=299642 RepID=A0A8X6UTK2_NEPPI|nr:zinc transporter ZIP3 [Nephila pilipes]
MQVTCYLTPILVSKCWKSRAQSIVSPVRAIDRKNLGNRLISWFNCIAIGIFLGMCFLSLLPDVLRSFAIALKKHGYKNDFPVAECCIVMGIFLTLLMEQSVLSWKESKDSLLRDDVEQNQGLLEECEMQDLSDEPVYLHEDHEQRLVAEFQNSPLPHSNCREENSQNVDNLSVVNRTNHILGNSLLAILVNQGNGFSLFIFTLANGLHSIFEGIALGLQTNKTKAVHYFIAIIVHECIIALAIGINSSRLRFSFLHYMKYAFVYSSVIPSGILIGIAVGHAPGTVGEFAALIVQTLSTGIFFYVTFLDFLPYEFSTQKDRILKVLFLVLGFSIFVAIVYFTS